MTDLRRFGAMTLVAGALFAAGCDSDAAPAFEVEGTGSLEGLVFFDRDRNGIFDPSAGDSLLPNVRVRVQKRGSTEVLAGGEATAGANGRFLIASLPPGTHDLVVDTSSARGVKFCQNPIPVDVYLNERQFSALSGRIACIVSIADAQKALNQVVVIYISKVVVIIQVNKVVMLHLNQMVMMYLNKVVVVVHLYKRVKMYLNHLIVIIIELLLLGILFLFDINKK